MSHHETTPLDARLVLKLNTPVLNALFPEGTAARVELQQAVVAEFARTVARQSMNDEAIAYLTQLGKDVASAANLEALVNQHFERSGVWNQPMKIRGHSEIIKTLATAAQTSYEDHLHDLIAEAATKACSAYEEKLEASVKYAVDKRVRSITAEMIQAKVNEAVKAAALVLGA